MDYGYQLLRHIVAQVFGNFRYAAQLTLLLTLIPSMVLFVTNPAVFALRNTGAEIPVDAISFGGLLAGLFTAVACWCWAAVGWHRFVLCEEYPMGIVPPFSASRIGAYFLRAVAVVAVILVVLIGAGFLIAMITAATGSGLIALVMGAGLVVGYSWLFVRIGLVLPAAAIGERLSIAQSWRLTGPVSGQILLPIVVVGILGSILGNLTTAIFGFSSVGLAVSTLLSWLQILLNLSLMTTLFGNLVEGRKLN